MAPGRDRPEVILVSCAVAKNRSIGCKSQRRLEKGKGRREEEVAIAVPLYPAELPSIVLAGGGGKKDGIVGVALLAWSLILSGAMGRRLEGKNPRALYR